MTSTKNHAPAIFIIPGNPPAVHFYELWKIEILHLLPEAQVHIAVYPEVSGGAPSALALQEVLEHLEQQLRKFVQKTKGPISIWGHSLGGYFAYELLKRNQHIVKDICWLFPFLRQPSPQGQSILRAMKEIQEKEFLRGTLFKSRKMLERLAPDLRHVTGPELVNSLKLAFHEYHTIGQDTNPLEIALDLRPKIRLIYNLKDTWCPLRLIENLKNQVASHQVSVPHAFVVSRSERELLLTKILNFPNAKF